MKKLLLVLAVVILPTLLCASGYFYTNPITMRYDTSFGLLEGNWDLVLRNPAHLSLIKGNEYYTLFNRNGTGYDEFEIGFRKYFSEKLGAIAIYFSKMIYNDGNYQDNTDATFTDLDFDGISDEKDISFVSSDDIEKENEYKILFNYGKMFTEKLMIGLGLALYLDDHTISWNDIDEFTKYDLNTSNVLETENSVDKGEIEPKKNEFDLNLGSIYNMNKDVSIEGTFSYNNIKNGVNINDAISTYEHTLITGYQESSTENYTGSDIWWDSSYSGSGFGIDMKFNYNKLKNHKFSLDLLYKSINADVKDDSFNDDSQYKELTPNGSLIETSAEKETEVYTQTGTGVKNNNLGLFLRYYRPFNDKVKFSAGIKVVPFNKTTVEFTQDYKYDYSKDFNDGDSEANDGDDWHRTRTYSNSQRVKGISEENIISFPIAVEIRKSDVLVWRAGVEHYIANYRDTWEYELLSETKTETHYWDDAGGESWSSGTTPGNYHYGDKDSTTSFNQQTDFKLGVCYTPVKNLHIDARLTRKNIELTSFSLADIEDTDIGFSVQYLF